MENCVHLVERSLAHVDQTSPEARAEVYRQLRESLDKLLARDGANQSVPRDTMEMKMLEAGIQEVENKLLAGARQAGSTGPLGLAKTPEPHAPHLAASADVRHLDLERPPGYWKEVARIQAEQDKLVPRAWAFAAVAFGIMAVAAGGFAAYFHMLNAQASLTQTAAAPAVSALADRYAEAKATYADNQTTIAAITRALEARQSRDGSFPESENRQWMPWPAMKAREGAALARTPSFPANGQGGFLYRSDGKDYKLVALSTKDCFVAQIEAPGMVDPARSAGTTDCIAYGTWSAGAANW